MKIFFCGGNSRVKKLWLISRVYLFWEIFLSWKISLSTIWLPQGQLWVIIWVITPLTRYYSLFHHLTRRSLAAWWRIWALSQVDCLVGFKPRTFWYTWSALTTNMERFSRLFLLSLNAPCQQWQPFMPRLVYLVQLYMVQYIYGNMIQWYMVRYGTMIYGTIRRSNWNNASIGLENKKEQFQSKLYYPK